MKIFYFGKMVKKTSKVQNLVLRKMVAITDFCIWEVLIHEYLWLLR